MPRVFFPVRTIPPAAKTAGATSNGKPSGGNFIVSGFFLEGL
jgi:hypothetical protein